MPLESAYRWERSSADDVWLTQPMGGGVVRDLTWAEAMGEARRMAAHLQSLDLPPRSNIAILAKNQAHWILADLAIWMSGHVSVPLYATFLADNIAHVLEHSDSRLLFVGKLDTPDELEKGVPKALPRIALPLAPASAACGRPWDGIVRATGPLRENPVRAPTDLATIIYTSGSTGAPKGAMHSFAAMAAAAAGISRILAVRRNDRMLSYLPLAHAMERWAVEMSSITHGFRLFFTESLETFLDDLRRARPTVFLSVPRLWIKFQLGVFAKVSEKKLDRLLGVPILSGIVKRKVLKGLGLDSVRFAGSGSAPIPPEVIGWYRRLGLELLEGYGMTENFGYSHVSLPGRVRVGYVGNPNPDVQCRIGDEQEVQVKSPATMLGYYKAPALTAEAFTPDGWLRTGDRGEIDQEGRLKITGRLKEIFKTSKGKYVVPAPIENKLLASKRLELACVMGAGYAQPFAAVQLSEQVREELERGRNTREETSAALGKLREEVNATLEAHERLEFLAVVDDVWRIDNGYLTPTMKIRRQVIEEAFAPLARRWYEAREKVVWQSEARASGEPELHHAEAASSLQAGH
jgi:long-chain acyl-CoA synthetase